MLREARGSVTRSPLTAAGLQALPCISAPDQLNTTIIYRAQKHRQEGSGSLHAHMPRSSASWGGQTDDTLSSFQFLVTSSKLYRWLSTCTYARMYTHINTKTSEHPTERKSHVDMYMSGQNLLCITSQSR